MNETDDIRQYYAFNWDLEAPGTEPFIFSSHIQVNGDIRVTSRTKRELTLPSLAGLVARNLPVNGSGRLAGNITPPNPLSPPSGRRNPPSPYKEQIMLHSPTLDDKTDPNMIPGRVRDAHPSPIGSCYADFRTRSYRRFK